MVGAIASAAAVAGCGGGGGAEPTPDASTMPTVSIVSDALPLRVVAGEETTRAVRIARSGGFSGDVLVELVDLPTGVSASAEIIPTASDQVVLVPRAVASAPQGGPHDATLRVAAADGRDITAELPIRVYVAGASGAADPSFGTAGRAAWQARTDQPTEPLYLWDLNVDSEGRALLTVTFDGGTYDAFVQRLGVDGRVDTSFGDAGRIGEFGGLDAFVREVAIMSDGLAVLGFVDTTGSGDNVGFLRRFDDEGGVVTTFGTGGDVSFADATGLPGGMLRDGDRLVLYVSDRYVRYDASGQLDPTFELRPRPESGGLRAASRDGYFLRESLADYSFARYLPNGDLDETYGGDGSATVNAGPEGETYSGNVLEFFVLPGGAAVVVGNAQAFGPSYREIFRLTPTGELDPSYGTAGFAESLMEQTALDADLDSRGGVVEIVNRVGDSHRLRRITSAGTLDTDFAGGEVVLEDTASIAAPKLAVDVNAGRAVVCRTDNDDSSGTMIARIVCWRYWL